MTDTIETLRKEAAELRQRADVAWDFYRVDECRALHAAAWVKQNQIEALLRKGGV
jgi:hypothetical protein